MEPALPDAPLGRPSLPTAKQIAYLHLCQRKLWLFSYGLNMEQTSQAVADGVLLSKSAYPRRAERYRELDVLGSRIDQYDPKERLVHEVKRSSKSPAADLAQVRYYLWLLELCGVEGPSAILEYPRQRKTQLVPPLTPQERAQAAADAEQVRAVAGQEACPPLLRKPICKSCAYFDFCYAGEE